MCQLSGQRWPANAFFTWWPNHTKSQVPHELLPLDSDTSCALDVFSRYIRKELTTAAFTMPKNMHIGHLAWHLRDFWRVAEELVLDAGLSKAGVSSVIG